MPYYEEFLLYWKYRPVSTRLWYLRHLINQHNSFLVAHTSSQYQCFNYKIRQARFLNSFINPNISELSVCETINRHCSNPIYKFKEIIYLRYRFVCQNMQSIFTLFYWNFIVQAIPEIISAANDFYYNNRNP